MKPNTGNLDRRSFVKTMAAAGAGLMLSGPNLGAQTAGANQPAGKIKLGFDNFAVRAMGWKADALIDYAAALKIDSLFISDLDAFENHSDSYLKGLKSKADGLGLQIHVGTWSICPTSKVFKNKWGTADEHLALGIRVAKAVGSPVIRVILGNNEDRKTEGGIEARIRDTIKVCKAAKSQAMDARVKIAVENHAGDMQAWELVGLVEEAGREYVGVCLDSGNACWTMEDPLASLEILGPYAVTTSLRDSMIWECESGAKVQWTAMGEGMIDFKTYFKRFAELCPGVPVHIETISGFARELSYLKLDYWNAYPKARAKDLARFVALAKHGKAIEPHRSPDNKAEQEYQKGEIERSMKYCKETLGLGAK